MNPASDQVYTSATVASHHGVCARAIMPAAAAATHRRPVSSRHTAAMFAHATAMPSPLKKFSRAGKLAIGTNFNSQPAMMYNGWASASPRCPRRSKAAARY